MLTELTYSQLPASQLERAASLPWGIPRERTQSPLRLWVVYLVVSLPNGRPNRADSESPTGQPAY
jgi:hypothetical protein